MYRRILLAYDGSPKGARALLECGLLAKSCCADVLLLAVVPVNAGTRMAESVYCGVAGHQVDEHKALLEQAVKRLSCLCLNVRSRIMVGEPTPIIAAVAKEINADLVVVAHHSQNILSRWWSGSGKDYLSDHIPCSLLIAKAAISDDAFEAEAANATPESDTPAPAHT